MQCAEHHVWILTVTYLLLMVYLLATDPVRCNSDSSPAQCDAIKAAMQWTLWLEAPRFLLALGALRGARADLKARVLSATTALGAVSSTFVITWVALYTNMNHPLRVDFAMMAFWVMNYAVNMYISTRALAKLGKGREPALAYESVSTVTV